jgi:hypothetical protein
MALCLIPRNGVQMAIYCAGTWLATAATLIVSGRVTTLEAAQSALWPWMLGAVYLPMLVLLLREPKSATAV